MRLRGQAIQGNSANSQQLRAHRVGGVREDAAQAADLDGRRAARAAVAVARRVIREARLTLRGLAVARDADVALLAPAGGPAVAHLRKRGKWSRAERLNECRVARARAEPQKLFSSLAATNHVVVEVGGGVVAVADEHDGVVDVGAALGRKDAT